MRENIIRSLRGEEGEVLHEYKDHLGYSTIGIGRLIDKRKGGGITKDEAAYLLGNDVDKVVDQLNKRIPWWTQLDDSRKGVLVNMAFQMGTDGLLGFKNTLAMIQRGDYNNAANGMMNSLWARQTPARAKRMAEQMRTGKWQYKSGF